MQQTFAQLAAFLTSKPGLLTLAGVACLAVFVWQNWAAIKARAGKMFASAATAQQDTETDPDILDMRAMKRLDLRFAKLQCKEGQAAMRTVKDHFFHDDSPAPAVLQGAASAAVETPKA